MPTVARIDGLRVVIWPNDHRPPHVHVIGGGGEAVFELSCPHGPPVLRESFGFRLADVRAIAARVNELLPDLCGKWSDIHGDQ